jgi:threonine synthase
VVCSACSALARSTHSCLLWASGCDPVKRAWERGEPVTPVVPDTVADGIAVGAPLFGVPAIQAVQDSGGAFVSVSDESMAAAASLMATRAGVIAEPAGAAAMAGLAVSLESGLIGRGERVVVHVTGSGLKMPQFLKAARAPLDIDADLAEVDRVVRLMAR